MLLLRVASALQKLSIFSFAVTLKAKTKKKKNKNTVSYCCVGSQSCKVSILRAADCRLLACLAACAARLRLARWLLTVACCSPLLSSPLLSSAVAAVSSSLFPSEMASSSVEVKCLDTFAYYPVRRERAIAAASSAACSLSSLSRTARD